MVSAGTSRDTLPALAMARYRSSRWKESSRGTDGCPFFTSVVSTFRAVMSGALSARGVVARKRIVHERDAVPDNT